MVLERGLGRGKSSNSCAPFGRDNYANGVHWMDRRGRLYMRVSVVHKVSLCACDMDPNDDALGVCVCALDNKSRVAHGVLRQCIKAGYFFLRLALLHSASDPECSVSPMCIIPNCIYPHHRVSLPPPTQATRCIETKWWTFVVPQTLGPVVEMLYAVYMVYLCQSALWIGRLSHTVCVMVATLWVEIVSEYTRVCLGVLTSSRVGRQLVALHTQIRWPNHCWQRSPNASGCSCRLTHKKKYT